MSLAIYIVVGVILVFVLVSLARALLHYWEDQVHLTEEDLELERRVKQLNDQLANKRSDDEIVRILSGQEAPTLFRKRRKEKE